MMPRIHVWVLVLLLLASGALSAGFAPLLSARVPTHWGVNGQVDAYGSKWISLLLFPAIVIAMLLLFLVLPLIGPFRRNFEQFRVTYGRIAITIVAGFIGLQLVVLLNDAGHHLRIGASFAVIIGVMFAVLGNWLSKVRRNFYVGIRTPWTLANEAVWERTHRLGAKVFVAFGLVLAATGLIAPQDWMVFVVLIAGVAFIVLWSLLYSLYWYRRLGQVDELPAE